MKIGHLTANEFLRDYWQKKAVLLKCVYPSDFAPITPEDLAGLACEEDIDARLIECDPKKNRWLVEHGPFDETRFGKLKKENWTLLVQGVDHWDRDVAALRQLCDFIPSWRFDDIMISYAVKGGGVGPHLDQYDVFLIQGLGKRRWLVGAKDQPVQANTDITALKQILPYEPLMDVIVEPGDVLYVPPNTPHWGTALEPCLTYSIGFRAPSATDILTRFAEYLVDHCIDGPRYSDPNLSTNNKAGEIPAHAFQQVTELLQAALTNRSAVESAFAQLLTQPRYSLEPETKTAMTASKLQQHLSIGKILRRLPDARCAWFVASDGTLRFFANGQPLDETVSSETAMRLCEVDQINAKSTNLPITDLAFLDLLSTLVNRGVFSFR